MFLKQVFSLLCLLSLHLCPWRTSVFWGLFRGNWSCTALRWYKCPPASSISSLFSVLMLQWSSSALSTVTPKQLLDSFTFIVTCQTHRAQNICHGLILIDVGLCSKWHLCKIAQKSSYRIHYSLLYYCYKTVIMFYLVIFNFIYLIYTIS